jgi:hypothetical protein
LPGFPISFGPALRRVVCREYGQAEMQDPSQADYYGRRWCNILLPPTGGGSSTARLAIACRPALRGDLPGHGEDWPRTDSCRETSACPPPRPGPNRAGETAHVGALGRAAGHARQANAVESEAHDKQSFPGRGPRSCLRGATCRPPMSDASRGRPVPTGPDQRQSVPRKPVREDEIRSSHGLPAGSRDAFLLCDNTGCISPRPTAGHPLIHERNDSESQMPCSTRTRSHSHARVWIRPYTAWGLGPSGMHLRCSHLRSSPALACRMRLGRGLLIRLHRSSTPSE